MSLPVLLALPGDKKLQNMKIVPLRHQEII